MNIILIRYMLILEFCKNHLLTLTKTTRTNAKPCATLEISILSHYTDETLHREFMTMGLSVLIKPTSLQFYAYF